MLHNAWPKNKHRPKNRIISTKIESMNGRLFGDYAEISNSLFHKNHFELDSFLLLWVTKFNIVQHYQIPNTISFFKRSKSSLRNLIFMLIILFLCLLFLFSCLLWHIVGRDMGDEPENELFPVKMCLKMWIFEYFYILTTDNELEKCLSTFDF